MKKLIVSCLLSVLFISATFAQYGTERTGYEGDYFSLEGALELFKQSYTLRDFERKLNTEENWVNNLDLNYDGRIDYIRVEHRRQGNFHAVILQALVDRNDVQDVAVIEIEKIGNREAVLQIVGDEDLYGEEVIVEPVEGYTDSRRGSNSDYGDFVNVYYWEPVQYILGRQYRVYASPYRWQYYPTWWSPWRQFTWSIFRPRIVIYHRYFHVVRRHRVIRVHNFYRNYRTYSYNVVQRTNKVRIRHGRAPINRPRPAVQQDRRPSSDNRSRNSVVERPRVTTRSSTPAQSPSVSRKRTVPADNQKASRSTIPRADQRSRSSATSPRTPRSTTPVQKPSVRSRSTTPAANQKASRSTTPQVRQPSRSSTPRSRTTTRPTNPTRKPSASSRTAPAPKPKVNRSTPSKVNQPSRNQSTRSSTSTRSRTTTRATTPARKPATRSSRSAPPSKPKATRSVPSKRSSSKSRSRSGGGGAF